jgi:hypothetical protein
LNTEEIIALPSLITIPLNGLEMKDTAVNGLEVKDNAVMCTGHEKSLHITFLADSYTEAC